MFISIWVLLFAEGLFQGLLGISLYVVVFLIAAKKGNLGYVLLVFLPVGLALDFILFLPIGTNWILSIITYFTYYFLSRIFQGISGISLFVTSFMALIIYYLLRFSVIFIAEGGYILKYLTWSVSVRILLAGLISAILVIVINGLIDLIAKPKEKILKLK